MVPPSLFKPSTQCVEHPIDLWHSKITLNEVIKLMLRMSGHQRAFAELILDGVGNHAKAYRIAYRKPHCSPLQAKVEGYRLINHPKIAKYIELERVALRKIGELRAKSRGNVRVRRIEEALQKTRAPRRKGRGKVGVPTKTISPQCGPAHTLFARTDNRRGIELRADVSRDLRG